MTIYRCHDCNDTRNMIKDRWDQASKKYRKARDEFARNWQQHPKDTFKGKVEDYLEK